MPGKGRKNSPSLGKYLGFAVPGTSNRFMTLENFHLLFFPWHSLGRPDLPWTQGGSSLLPSWGCLAALLLLCRNAANAGPLQLLSFCTQTVLSSGTAAGTVLSSGHLPPLGYSRSHPGPEILAKVLIKTRSAS